jgi:hypothetical protein
MDAAVARRALAEKGTMLMSKGFYGQHTAAGAGD